MKHYVYVVIKKIYIYTWWKLISSYKNSKTNLLPDKISYLSESNTEKTLFLSFVELKKIPVLIILLYFTRRSNLNWRKFCNYQIRSSFVKVVFFAPHNPNLYFSAKFETSLKFLLLLKHDWQRSRHVPEAPGRPFSTHLWWHDNIYTFVEFHPDECWLKRSLSGLKRQASH